MYRQYLYNIISYQREFVNINFCRPRVGDPKRSAGKRFNHRETQQIPKMPISISPRRQWTYSLYRTITSFLPAESILRLRRWLNPAKEEFGHDHIRRRLGRWDHSLDVDTSIIFGNNNTGQTVWFHAASAGESTATLPILSRLVTQLPSARIVLSVGTQTGRMASTAALQRHGLLAHTNIVVVAPPVDTPEAVDGFLSYFQPTHGVMMESELWPNLIHGAKSRNVRLSVLNGRLSSKTYLKWTQYESGIKMLVDMVCSFDMILSQSVADTDRYNNIVVHASEQTCPSVKTIPNLKLAAMPLLKSKANVKKDKDSDPTSVSAGSTCSTLSSWEKSVVSARQLFQELDNGTDPSLLNVVVASTHDREEVEVASALLRMKKAHRIVYTPRHPERSEAVMMELSSSSLVDVVLGAKVMSRTTVCTSGEINKDNALSLIKEYEIEKNDVLHGRRAAVVVSAMGVLPSLYAAADVAIVGGGLVDTNGAIGQHNVLEALREGCIVLYGKQCGEAFESEIVPYLAAAASAQNGTSSATKSYIQIDLQNASLHNILETLAGASESTKKKRREDAKLLAKIASDGVVEQIWLHLLPWIEENRLGCT